MRILSVLVETEALDSLNQLRYRPDKVFFFVFLFQVQLKCYHNASEDIFRLVLRVTNLHFHFFNLLKGLLEMHILSILSIILKSIQFLAVFSSPQAPIEIFSDQFIRLDAPNQGRSQIF